jgi:3'-phosphoadenosine 5'-phosphosulfate sulfotransferase (PAPS reductase)/FAD synthetase
MKAAEVYGKIPVLLDPEVECRLEGLKEQIDGFRSVEEAAVAAGARDKAAVAALICRWAEDGHAVWLDEWSPLHWCRPCNLPLLQDHCDRCGAPAPGRVPLKFPCNPRPVLPHDQRMFREAGLPWPVNSSVVINNYWLAGLNGWQVIAGGETVGEVVQSSSDDAVRYVPAAGRDGSLPAGSGNLGPTLDDVIAANAGHLDRLERKALEFIREWRSRKLLTFTICTFSGGKDSAVLADICNRSGVKMRLLQIDTGIDPVGNAEYSDRLLAGYQNLKPRRIANGDLFWRAMERLGPPAQDFQWCRIVLKNSAPYRSDTTRLAGLLGFIRPVLPVRVLIVDGPRRREETWRIELKPSVGVPDAPVETIMVRPILDFTDLDIWMHLRRHGIPINPTYTGERNQRLLCLFCPDKDRSELDSVREQRPELWQRFEDELRRWQQRLGYPDEWVTRHLWVCDKATSDHMRALGIDTHVAAVAERLDSVVSLGEPVEQDGTWVRNGRINGPFELDALGDWLRPFGSPGTRAGHEGLVVRSARGTVAVAADGEWHCSAGDRETAEDRGEDVKDWIVSHLNCIGCGACKAPIRHVRARQPRAGMSRRCPECPDAVREAIRVCPVNARGVWRCTAKRQDG